MHKSRRFHYDILIPIHNARIHAVRCIDSVLSHTNPRHSVYLLDDGSSDKRLIRLLNRFATGHPEIRLIRNRRNLGFVHTVNHALSLSRNDVVLLNSDTVVTPGWLDKMDRCRRNNLKAGIVCPLTNNGGPLSIPKPWRDNRFAEPATPDRVSKIVARYSRKRYPSIPVAAGFCALITRQTVDKVGLLSPLFNPGYGEICDYSFRALSKGFTIICCDDAYVEHFGGATFRSKRKVRTFRKRGNALLTLIWKKQLSAIEPSSFAPLQVACEPINAHLFRWLN